MWNYVPKYLKILKFFNVIISPWYTIKVDKCLVNVEQLSYIQIHVHFSVIWNSEVRKNIQHGTATLKYIM